MSNIIHITSIAQIHKALGLSAPMHPLISLIEIDEKVTSYDYGDATYVYDFYQIAFKSGITGDITYGRNHYDYDQGSMVFTKQVRHNNIVILLKPRMRMGGYYCFIQI